MDNEKILNRNLNIAKDIWIQENSLNVNRNNLTTVFQGVALSCIFGIDKKYSGSITFFVFFMLFFQY